MYYYIHNENMYILNVTGFWKTDHIVAHEINRTPCVCICNFNKYILLNYSQCLNSNLSCV